MAAAHSIPTPTPSRQGEVKRSKENGGYIQQEYTKLQGPDEEQWKRKNMRKEQSLAGRRLDMTAENDAQMEGERDSSACLCGRHWSQPHSRRLARQEGEALTSNALRDEQGGTSHNAAAQSQ
jgi:hypothetical protein